MTYDKLEEGPVTLLLSEVTHARSPSEPAREFATLREAIHYFMEVDPGLRQSASLLRTPTEYLDRVEIEKIYTSEKYQKKNRS